MTNLFVRSIRRPLLAAVTLTLATLSTACSDGTDTAATPVAPAAASPIVHATTLYVAGDTTVEQFTVQPGWADSYEIGGVHRVDFAAGSICDPQTSTYGATEWDKPCTVLTRPITFTAKSYTDAAGHPRVTFSPDVRFVPGKTNTLLLKDKGAAADLAHERIVWCPTGSARCIDESATDAGVATTLQTNGMLARRVKHFSGYTVVAD